MKRIYLRIKNCLLFITSCFLALSCHVGSHVQAPTYVHVDSFHFVQNPLAGSKIATHQVTEVWAYYNDVLIGAFDLPANIPVITNGNAAGRLSLSPGIVVDGMNNLLGVYPFYQPDTFSFTAQPGNVITHNPVTEFYTDAKFDAISHFNYSVVAGTSFVLAGAGVAMSLGTDPVMGKVGVVNFSMTGNDTVSKNISVDSILIPLNVPAYIEFDYKSSVPFYVGMDSYLPPFPSATQWLAGINPRDHWQKFYLSVADLAAQNQASYYYFHLKASLPAGQQSGVFEIANVQLVTF